VLDGGWKKWLAEGRPTTMDIPDFVPAIFIARPDASLIRTGDQVATALGAGQALVDVRTPDEFAGRSSRARRYGHIPTAINLPRGKLTTPEGTAPPADALHAAFSSALGDVQSDDVVFYCNAGVSASYGLLAWRAAGNTGGAVYDGSWKDWGNADDPIGRPVVGPTA
jgi:thiosulfate/3-mercaptopyruvate sulfurtransferase